MEAVEPPTSLCGAEKVSEPVLLVVWELRALAIPEEMLGTPLCLDVGSAADSITLCARRDRDMEVP